MVDFQLGVVAVFSIGYYCLPIWFKSRSSLGYRDEALVAETLVIFLLFLGFVVVGTWVGRRVVREQLGLDTSALDGFVDSHRLRLSILAFGLFLFYYTTQELTSYSAADSRVYFSQRGGSSAIIAAAADLALAWLALSIALASRDRRRLDFIASVFMLGFCVFLLLFVGQRLALLTPIAMVMAAFAFTGQMKGAFRTLGLAVLALLIVSPIAVAVRESGSVSAEYVVGSYSYGDDPGDTIFQSIIDRGDLLDVSAGMKQYIDADPLPGPMYYSSVLLNPIPRVLFPAGSKPFPLSTDGSPTGELSIYAWGKLHGSGMGSLSAFGGIVAYREMRWPGVVLNGILTGVFFVWASRWLGQGGLVGKLFYAGLFVSLSIRKAPPSFWESILALMPLLPLLALAVLGDRLQKYVVVSGGARFRIRRQIRESLDVGRSCPPSVDLNRSTISKE